MKGPELARAHGRRMLLVLGAVLLLGACRGEGGVTGGTSAAGGGSGGQEPDTTAPELESIVPQVQSQIGPGTLLRITFSEPLDADSLALGGSLVPEATVTVEEDEAGTGTVVLSPITAWSAGEQTLELDGADPAGNAFTPLSVSWVVDATPPVASADWADGDVINEDEAITLIFSTAGTDLLESVNAGSLDLGGSLGDVATAGWDADFTTLTLTPATVWPAGEGQTLTVDVEDLLGNALERLSLSLIVLNSVVYVDGTDGDDTNLGTASSPLKSLHAAVALAEAHFSAPGFIRAAGGTYTLDTDTGPLLLHGPATLDGGYDASDWEAAPDTLGNPTIITNADALDGTGKMVRLLQPSGGGDPAGLRRVTLVETGKGLTTVYVQDGLLDRLTVQGGVLGVEIVGPGTLRDSTVTAGDYAAVRVVDLMDAGQALVERNVLQGGDNTSGDGSVGLEIRDNASPVVRNNLISAGTGTDPAPIGIAFLNSAESTAQIHNNTVYGGPVVAGAAAIYGDSKAGIRNNILFTGTGGICVDGDAGALRNNDLWGCDAGYYGSVTDLGTTMVVTVESSDLTLADLGNVDTDPGFEDAAGTDTFTETLDDNDWHLDTAAPADVRFGGLDLSSSFPDDLEKTARTPEPYTDCAPEPTNAGAAGWSMGAYEQDFATPVCP